MVSKKFTYLCAVKSVKFNHREKCFRCNIYDSCMSSRRIAKTEYLGKSAKHISLFERGIYAIPFLDCI